MPAELITTLRADEFHILESFRPNVGPDGAIEVFEGQEGYIIYGPYWTMTAGTYVVRPNFCPNSLENCDQDEDFGIIEVCDRGVILCSTPLVRDAILTARLPVIKGLEIRIFARGKPL